ncbi:MAG TPA: class I SAM-dependent methyltransferase [Acidimicrobiia bacterium]|nr:class I SAM-dependent methyltransferase [Acidimicrobiia bacterium]
MGHTVPGGIVIGDAGLYDWLSRLILGSFYEKIAADIADAVPRGAQVLEVGCGPGHLTMELTRRGFDVTGLDLDPAMIERARANAERHSGQIEPEFRVGDVAALPHPNQSFDLVVSTLSMHHWADPTAGLAEIDRVLRPQGRALIWDLGSGIRPLHGHMPDPAEQLHDSPLRLVSVAPWPWPWKLSLTQRMELVHGDPIRAPMASI